MIQQEIYRRSCLGAHKIDVSIVTFPDDGRISILKESNVQKRKRGSMKTSTIVFLLETFLVAL